MTSPTYCAPCIADLALVTQAVASVLGVGEEPGRPLGDALADYLHSRDVLIVLDNCEHVVSACAAHGVQALLTRTDHATGSDRLAEACALLGLGGDEIVVNVQGDEPLIEQRRLDRIERGIGGIAA